MALLLWLVVPVALDQTQQALEGQPQGGADGTFESIRDQVLVTLESELLDLSSGGDAVSAVIDTLTRARWHRLRAGGNRVLGH